jgi:hypothetical protein
MSDDRIAEIRARHEDNASIGSIIHGPDRPPRWTLVGWKAHHDRAFLLLELDRVSAEIERLRNEDTKARHALGGWVWVCPDGGDEPTHERVAAVVAEIERLRARVEQLDQVREAALNASADWYLSLRVDQRDSIEYVEPNIGLMGSMSKLFEIAWDATPATQNATGARGKP